MFFAAGSAYTKAHTRNIESLGGLIKKMPFTGALFIIGCIAITGVPPLNGFISEFLIYAGMLLGIPASEISLFIVLVISIAALALAGTMAIVCFSKASGLVFLGEARTENAKNVESDVCLSMIIPMTLLAIGAFLIGLFPQVVIRMILTPVSLFVRMDSIQQILYSILNLTQTLSWIFCGFLVLLIVALVIKICTNKLS